MIIVVIKFKMLIYLIYMNSNERIKYACEILNEKVIELYWLYIRIRLNFAILILRAKMSI